MAEQAAELYDKWMRAWNGELDLVDEIVAEDFVFHPTNPDAGGEDYSGRDGVRKMINASRDPFTSIEFTVEIQPIVQDDRMAARWVGEGVYAGGLPGATADAGTPVRFNAIDIFRVADGMLAEYWHNADDLTFMASLGVVSFPEG